MDVKQEIRIMSSADEMPAGFGSVAVSPACRAWISSLLTVSSLIAGCAVPDSPESRMSTPPGQSNQNLGGGSEDCRGSSCSLPNTAAVSYHAELTALSEAWLVVPMQPEAPLKGRYFKLEFRADSTDSLEWRFEKGENVLSLPAPEPNDEVQVLVANSSSGWRWLRSSARSGGASQSFILPANFQVGAIGVEAIGPGNLQQQSTRAFSEAKELDGNALPLAQVGKTYSWSWTFPNGSEISSASLRGKVVIFEHWATYCGACTQVSLPRLMTLSDEHPGEVAVIAVNVDPQKNTEAVDKFLPLLSGRGWHTISVPSDTPAFERYSRALTGRRLLGEGIPMVMLIDRTGKLLYVGNFQDDGTVNLILQAALRATREP